MKVLLTLLLLPFIFIIELIKGIFGGAFGAKNLKYIPKIIEHLANNPSLIGTAFQEVKFPQVLAYAEEMGTLIKKESNYFKFIIIINSTTYLVEVGRAHDGSNCAVFHSEIKAEKSPPITSINSGKKATPSPNIIETLEIAYDKHEQNCRW